MKTSTNNSVDSIVQSFVLFPPNQDPNYPANYYHQQPQQLQPQPQNYSNSFYPYPLYQHHNSNIFGYQSPHSQISSTGPPKNTYPPQFSLTSPAYPPVVPPKPSFLNKNKPAYPAIKQFSFVPYTLEQVQFLQVSTSYPNNTNANTPPILPSTTPYYPPTSSFISYPQNSYPSSSQTREVTFNYVNQSTTPNPTTNSQNTPFYPPTTFPSYPSQTPPYSSQYNSNSSPINYNPSPSTPVSQMNLNNNVNNINVDNQISTPSNVNSVPQISTSTTTSTEISNSFPSQPPTFQPYYNTFTSMITDLSRLIESEKNNTNDGDKKANDSNSDSNAHKPNQEECTPGECKDEDDGKCLVCFDLIANTAIIPCGHLALCSPCAKAVVKKSNKCLICNSQISSIVQIFKVV